MNKIFLSVIAAGVLAGTTAYANTVFFDVQGNGNDEIFIEQLGTNNTSSVTVLGDNNGGDGEGVKGVNSRTVGVNNIQGTTVEGNDNGARNLIEGANNQSYVTIGGSNAEAASVIFGEGNYADVKAYGNGSRAFVSIFGEENTGQATAITPEGTPEGDASYANVQINGINNTGNIFARNGRADLLIDGERNNAAVRIDTPTEDPVALNTAFVDIDGQDNILNASIVGAGSSLNAIVAGNENQVFTDQFGNNNSINLNIGGNSNFASITQAGDGNLAGGNILGTNNTVIVNQNSF